MAYQPQREQGQNDDLQRQRAAVIQESWQPEDRRFLNGDEVQPIPRQEAEGETGDSAEQREGRPSANPPRGDRDAR